MKPASLFALLSVLSFAPACGGAKDDRSSDGPAAEVDTGVDENPVVVTDDAEAARNGQWFYCTVRVYRNDNPYGSYVDRRSIGVTFQRACNNAAALAWIAEETNLANFNRVYGTALTCGQGIALNTWQYCSSVGIGL